MTYKLFKMFPNYFHLLTCIQEYELHTLSAQLASFIRVVLLLKYPKCVFQQRSILFQGLSGIFKKIQLAMLSNKNHAWSK